MASKKQRASTSTGSGAVPTQPTQVQKSSLRASTMLGTLRLVALMSATIVALLVFEVLQTPLGFWPALGIGFVAGIVARAAFVWLERVWLGAAARRAAARESGRAEPEAAGKARRK